MIYQAPCHDKHIHVIKSQFINITHIKLTGYLHLMLPAQIASATGIIHHNEYIIVLLIPIPLLKAVNVGIATGVVINKVPCVRSAITAVWYHSGRYA